MHWIGMFSLYATLGIFALALAGMVRLMTSNCPTGDKNDQIVTNVRCVGQCGGPTIGRCTEIAEVYFNYVTSVSPKGERVPFCANCARAWQVRFGPTDVGSSLTVEAISK
jgi:hypothetical protein